MSIVYLKVTPFFTLNRLPIANSLHDPWWGRQNEDHAINLLWMAWLLAVGVLWALRRFGSTAPHSARFTFFMHLPFHSPAHHQPSTMHSHSSACHYYSPTLLPSPPSFVAGMPQRNFMLLMLHHLIV